MLSQSQQDILTNFGQLNTLFDVNHITFNNATAANRGRHRMVTMIAQGADPVAVAGFGQLYTKTTAGVVQLFYRSSAGTITQLTSTSPASGSILAWGCVRINQVTGNAVSYGFNLGAVAWIVVGTSFRVTFTNPLASANYAVVISATESGNHRIQAGTVIAASFDINRAASAGDYYYYITVIG